MFRKVAFGAISLLALTLPAYAHHSDALFDKNVRKWVTGTVVQWQWTNPHAWLIVMAPDSSGKSVQQSFEMGSPNTLIRDGFRYDSFKPGDTVKIYSAPRKDSPLGGQLVCARTAQGKWLAFGMGPGYKPPVECRD